MKTFLVLFTVILTGAALADETHFTMYDADGDQSVRYVEFAKVKLAEFQALDRDRSKTLTPAEYERGDSAAEWDLFALPDFSKMDTHGDENVAMQEFGSAVKEVFDTLDAIESGSPDERIAKGEYLTAIAQKEARARAATAAQASMKGSGGKKKKKKKKGSTTQPEI